MDGPQPVVEQRAEGHEWLRNTTGSSSQPFPTSTGQEENSHLFSKMLTLIPSSPPPHSTFLSLKADGKEVTDIRHKALDLGGRRRAGWGGPGAS